MTKRVKVLRKGNGITIDEAIKLLQGDIDDPGSVDIMDLNKAEGLGIEALKLIKHERWKALKTLYMPLLPGETED